jgi:hypothetical protein
MLILPTFGLQMAKTICQYSKKLNRLRMKKDFLFYPLRVHDVVNDTAQFQPNPNILNCLL